MKSLAQTPLINLNNPFIQEGLIDFVDNLIHHAQEQAASDIHIEPYEQACRIRLRQDGLLHEIMEIPRPLAERVITRLKVMADLDISEHRLPQDGRIKSQHTRHQQMDIRISTCPVMHGEKIVLRLMDSSKLKLSIDALGFNTFQKTLFLEKISQPQGLILLTGPTGSGKSLSLYSALDYLNQGEKNILTVEDPIEIQIKGINQVQLNTKAGLDFATTLRAFLRQDPDIIMLGEIRDSETAEIAVQAAQTGHLVLSTLHTNSAAEALTRLLSLGIAHYQLAPALQLIIAQRLVRKLCPACKQVDIQGEFFLAKGCQHCRQGYQGRTGLFECLAITEPLRQDLFNKVDTLSLMSAAQQQGFLSLKEAGIRKARQGQTSLAELKRVLVL